MKTRNILLRFLNHLPNGNKERKQEMKTQIEKTDRKNLPNRTGRMMAGAEEKEAPDARAQMPGESTAAQMTPATEAAMRMMQSAKAALLIILIVALPLLATSCRDHDDEPSAGGRLITVSRLRVSIDGMQSAAEMKAARSAEMKAGRNGALAGDGGEMRSGGDIRNSAQTSNDAQIRNGGDNRSGAQTSKGGDNRSGGNTRADAPTPDKNGYVGVEKKKFVTGDVLHFMVALTQTDYDNDNYQVYNATLQDNGIWLFDTPLVLPEDATKTHMIEVFYDGTKRLYTYYSTNTKGDDTAANGNAYAALEDALHGTKDDDTNLTTYPDLLYVRDDSGNWTRVLTPDGTLTLTFEHNNSLVRISSIDNRLGAKVTAIHANATKDGVNLAPVSLYPAATTTSSAAAPSADDVSAAAANGTVEAIIGDAETGITYLQSFTVTLDDGHEVIVPVPDGNGSLGRLFYPGESYTYHLLLLPGSVSAEEVNGAAPSYKVRRDPAVPAGYIPIYTAEDLRKIGVATNPDEVKNGAAPIYAPAIVNGYLYTNASSVLLAAEAQKDPIYDPATGAYTNSGYSEEATNAAITANGLDPTADATSDGSIDGTPTKVGPLTFSLDARYILMNDIDLTPKDGPAIGKDLNGIDQVKSEQLWTPIGDSTPPFTGRFHGNGFTIRGMTIYSSAAYLGLFGCIKGAVIYNVHLQDARVKGTTSNYYIGSLVGSCDYSTISSCSANGTGCAAQSTGNTYNIGGLVGNNNSGTLTRCHATTCSILSDVQRLYAGGLVGRNQGTLASCYTAGCTADCTNSNNIFGGLVGYNNSTIYGCYATYAQKSDASIGDFGSLVGLNTQGITASSYAINATDGTLGLVGDNNGGTITACVSPFKNVQSNGATGSGGSDPNGGSYWEIISNGNGTFSGGYAPLTDAKLLESLKNVNDMFSKFPFTATGNLANVYTLLVNNTGKDITDADKGGGDIGGLAHGVLKTIPPGGIYTVKHEWKASRIWGDTTPESLTIVLPRIDWTYNRGKEN